MTRYDCVVPSAGDGKVLVVREGDSWSLPHVVCDVGWVADAVADIQSRFRERYGAEVVVLRCLRWTDASVACELESFPVGRWPEREGLFVHARDCERRLSAEQAAAVTAWAQDRGWERRIAPWQRRGWFAEARQWIAARAGVLSALTQVKAGWNGSCVLRADTSNGTLYFKAAPRRRPGEPAVIRALSAKWSPHLPPLVDADEERCWLLMRDIGGRETDASDPAELADAARLVARIQIDQAPDAGGWLARGCPDRGLDVMRASLDRLLVEIPTRLHEAGVLGEEERAEMMSFVPRAATMCETLASFAVPPRSIHHEDFRDGNVQRTPSGALVIIDWNDTVVAHPFFTLQRFLWFMPPPEGVPRHQIVDSDDDACRRAFRDAYLDEFQRFESGPRLLEAFHISSRLSPVYDALRFASSPEVDEVFDRGLGPEERGIARHLMEHILEVCRDTVRFS